MAPSEALYGTMSCHKIKFLLLKSSQPVLTNKFGITFFTLFYSAAGTVSTFHFAAL